VSGSGLPIIRGKQGLWLGGRSRYLKEVTGEGKDFYRKNARQGESESPSEDGKKNLGKAHTYAEKEVGCGM